MFDYRWHQGIDIHGLIYMHRISDQRMSGSSRRAFSTLANICGRSAMRRLTIVTNMWDITPPDIGTAREAELQDNSLFYKDAIEAGARLLRNDKPPESGRNIVLNMSFDSPVRLAILTELLEEKKSLLETTAGRELDQELTQQRARHQAELRKLREEHALALQQQDEDATADLEAEMRKAGARIDELYAATTKLRERQSHWSRIQSYLPEWLTNLWSTDGHGDAPNNVCPLM